MSHRRTVLLVALAQTACSGAGGTPSETATVDGGSAETSGATAASGASGSKGSSGAATASGASGTSKGGASGVPAASGGSVSGASSDAGAKPPSEGGSAGNSSGASAAGSGSPCAMGCAFTDGGAAPVDGSAADGAPPVVLPVLTSLIANQSGRSGDDLLLTLQGTDLNQTAFALDIQLGDATGKPIAAFADWTGAPSASERIVLFDGSSAVGESSFNKTVTLAGFMTANPNIASVVAAVVDTVGTSATLPATVALQAIDSLNHGCDPEVITDRCRAGLGCDPVSATCVTPAPPQITQAAYVISPLGARMLFAGTDPADDLSSFHLEFLNATGQPVLVDVTGNRDLSSEFDIPVGGASKLGQFFYADQTVQSFDSTVLQIAATPMGTSTGAGARVTAMLEPPPVAGAGGACDLRGFAACEAGASCLQNPSSGASTCVVTATAQDAASSGAPTLDPAAGAVFTTGYANGPNIWGDAPSTCVPPGVNGFPEGIVHLHLQTSMPSLTLTTDNPETDFNAAVFVVKGQGASAGTRPIGCNADYPATVSLTNLAAGDYTIILEATATVPDEKFGIRIK